MHKAVCCALVLVVTAGWAQAQQRSRFDSPRGRGLPRYQVPPYQAPPLEAAPDKAAIRDSLIEFDYNPERNFFVMIGEAGLVYTRVPISRIAIADPSVVEVTQYGPREIEFVGRRPGNTSLLIWFGQGDNQPFLGYRINVGHATQYRQALLGKTRRQREPSKYLGPPVPAVESSRQRALRKTGDQSGQPPANPPAGAQSRQDRPPVASTYESAPQARDSGFTARSGRLPASRTTSGARRLPASRFAPQRRLPASRDQR